MKSRIQIAVFAVLLAVIVPPTLKARAGVDEWAGEQSRQERVDDSEADLYSEGTDAIDEEEWARAIDYFNRVIAMKHKRTDGALYWKAYAQSHGGRGADALETIAQLERAYPKSRWMEDARALEIDIKQSAGQRVAPEGVVDDELKLIAIQGLLSSDPERALPLLEKVVEGKYSKRVKEQALFVLSQSSSPKAASIIASIARGTSHADLQDEAIKYLGVMGGQRNLQLLEEVYQSTSNAEVKKDILRAFMVAGARPSLFTLAKTEKDAHVRAEAIRQLGVMGSGRELAELYRSESSAEVKKTIIESLFVGGSTDLLAQIARTEPDRTLRATAVRNLGLIGTERTGTLLVSFYQNESDSAVRKAALEGLFVQDNVRALITLARQEKDPRWKKEIVEKLSIMDSKEAIDYMSSLLDN